MFRASRPLFQVLKKTTGITGLAVHPNPLPALSTTYTETLSLLQKLPDTSVYRQSAEAITQRKLKIITEANGSVVDAEKQLDEGHIEQALAIAQDEAGLVTRMLEWESWEPLAEKPEAGQWEYAA